MNSILEFFGVHAEFDTYYKGKKLLPKPGFQSVCIFEYTIGVLVLEASSTNNYNTDEEHDPTQESYLGIKFRSADKIKNHTTGGGKTEIKHRLLEWIYYLMLNAI